MPEASMTLSRRPLAMPSASFTAPAKGRVRLRVIAHAASAPRIRLSTPKAMDRVPVHASVARYSSRLRSVRASWCRSRLEIAPFQAVARPCSASNSVAAPS
ncbi:hypothetical protein D3C73_1191990 [compost metagenome]